jgi:hypothetical protein
MLVFLQYEISEKENTLEVFFLSLPSGAAQLGYPIKTHTEVRKITSILSCKLTQQ